MNTVERIKETLKERNIAISKMEKDLGFSNGYIKSLRRGTIQADRLEAIAKYLNVSSKFLIYGEEESENTAEIKEDMRESFAYRVLFDTVKDATESEMLEAAAVIQRRKEERGIK